MHMILFDLDGTVTAQETLPAIARQFNIEKEIAQMTKETVEGKIPFIESFIMRVNLLKEYSVQAIQDVLASTPLHSHIIKFINEHKESCHIVTGNLDCWIIRLMEKVSCQYSCSIAQCANDRLINIKSIIDKADVVRDYKENGYKVTFVGEGNNDAAAMEIADIGIAFGAVHSPSYSALDVASHVVFDEKRLCSFLTQLL